MYNRLFKYLTTNEILHKKQFGFQKGHSIEHAIIQLIDQINNSFEKNHFTLGIFIDLSKDGLRSTLVTVNNILVTTSTNAQPLKE